MRPGALAFALLGAAALASASLLFPLACSETGPDAPPRENGCIGATCAPTPGTANASSSSGGGTGPGGAPVDGAITYGDPLEGTSRRATRVKGGFRFTEGPVWIGGRLLFTDIPENRIRELLPDAATPTFRSPSGNANGLAVDEKGNLVACEGGEPKRISRSAPSRGAPVETVVDRFDEARFNAPNDVVVRSDGNIYFTDPNYSGAPNTQDDEAVYRVPPGGAVGRIDHDFVKPNGIALSPDGATLYVVDNGAGKLFAGKVDAAGAASDFTELAPAPGGDGMAVDDAGNLYVTVNGGVDVLEPDGTKIGTIAVEVKPTNCTFGGDDRRTLYITANGQQPSDGGVNPRSGVYAIKLNVPGLP